jgi:hypothetical protein
MRWHDPDRDAAEYAQWQEDRGIEEHERSGGKWQSIFRQQAAEQPEVHYDDRPGYDRRLHSVDGDLPEQTRRDLERIEMPGVA